MGTGTGDSWIKALLDALQELYARLSARILDRRLTSYRKDTGAGVDREVLSSLFEIVEKTAKPEDPTHSSGVAEPALETAATLSEALEPDAGGKGIGAAAPGMHSELSDHMRTTRSGGADAGHLANKLTTSTWEHIHASLRYAREGNTELAKLHANLASEALNEASHHMSDETYMALKMSVLETLQGHH